MAINLVLTDEEAEALRDALDAYIEESQQEASRTEPGRLSKEAWHEVDLLAAVRSRM